MISKLTNASAAVTPSSAEPFDRRVLVVGGAAVAVLMAVSGRYGFHRDELYFMACAQHLQASYVDQPVLTPLLAWVSLKAFGVSLPGPVDDDGGGAAYLRQFFTSVRVVATLSNPYGLRNQEFGGHVYLCTGPRHPWGQMWPELRSYS
jgi:hypothetical protein